MKTKLLTACISASIALSSVGGTADAAPTSTPETVDRAENARLFAVPVLEPGKAAWVSVYDQSGRPMPGAILTLNGSPVHADNMGQASFTVPHCTALSVGIQAQTGKIVNQCEYLVTPGGYLVAEKQAQQAVDRIEESIVSNEQAPTIAYAPSVIETSQAFVLMGKNLSGKADGDHILVDGYDADVFSGSSVCLLATTPRRLNLGPLREMYITTGTETSNTVEVDVCKVDVSVTAAGNGTPETARVRTIGTNVPSLVEIRNLSAEIAGISFDKHKLGQRSAIITSGGENNSVDLEIARKQPGNIDLDTHLIADAPWSPDDRTTFSDANKTKIIAELNKGEILRLKRRLIAIEQRIAEEQQVRTRTLAAGTATPSVVDKINAQLRTLSNRQRRINAMVVARRAVFQALGGTEAEYRQALDDAAGGGAIALDKLLAPLTSAALLASTTATGVKPSSMQMSDAVDAAVNIDRQKELQQLAELTRMWKKFPTKVSHNTRLAPPPPPYIPDLKGLGHGANYEYTSALLKLGAPPPPLPLVALMKQHAKRTGRHATKASLSRKSSRQRSRSRGR